MGGVKARCAGSLGEKRVKGITDPRSLPGPSVALTVRTQYVHRTLRLFSYSSDPGVAAHWSSCSERIAPRSVAHLC
jgi:hypothetical protein